jgi:2-dehydro-3-deoxygluconokinase
MGRPVDTAQRIVAIGECMVELSDRPDNCRLGFGGDTLNTALYLARLGMPVDYVTVLGDDPYSDAMVEAWGSEGIGVRFVARAPGRLPGPLRDPHRRARRAALLLLARPLPGARAPDRRPCGRAWPKRWHRPTSSISAASPSPSSTTSSAADCSGCSRPCGRAAGAVAFDPNYRPAGWPDAASARTWFDAFYRISTHALPSIDDERTLHPGLAAQELVARLHSLGVAEVVVKQGDEGCWIDAGEGPRHVPVPASRRVHRQHRGR